MKTHLKQMIERWADNEGTTYQGALRDLLTDMRHIAEEVGLDFDAAVDGSADVFDEEHKEREEARQGEKRGLYPQHEDSTN